MINSLLNQQSTSISRNSDLYVVINSAYKITHASSKEGEEQMNLSHSDLWELLPPSCHNTFEDAFFRSKTEMIPIHLEVSKPLLSFKWVEVGIFPFGEGFSMFFKDLTRHKQVDQLITQNEKKLALLAEASSDLIFQEDPKELLDNLFNSLSHYLDLDVYFNYIFDERANKLRLMNYYGIPKEIADGMCCLDFGQAVCGTAALNQHKIIAEDISSSIDPKVNLIKSLGIQAYVCHPLISYGKLVGTLSFGSKTRTHFIKEELDLIERICTQVSITLDRLSLIAKLQQTNIELEQANTSLVYAQAQAEKAHKAKSDFLAMMSHELRTPLNSILGFSQLLHQDAVTPLSAQQLAKVDKILKSGRHLLAMINDILKLVKLENGKPFIEFQEVDLDAIVQAALSEITPYAQLKKLKMNCEELKLKSDQIIYSDPVRLHQVLLNLLSNSVKYNREHGNITISYQVSEHTVTVNVADTGVGISFVEQSKIFDPFYRTEEFSMEAEGTGIGLSLVKQIVTEMQGKIGVDSQLGEGSTFWIEIPIVKK
ncbi:GAF domain-containing sensor histidine kinase [Alkalihalophilus marmarensis]|jgi:signal transduction histidine kinase|uniref:histidine kinase n=1 Tax=Alkalihalophilus marmarensis DSM 21297 TaxID=1188261 RepID=U6SSF9_9BACI|nr:GAF domain-containing sensor histidine kinase [Alkalihalophilus marmarensis]ERN54649.1 hypothetical protein A33I_04700 [Alkalihalophilus marmarensis DSM 21297]MCM3488731.1 GAF domain-containing sensor histidine kinase [Alkalihalophilus marmarensis]